MKLFLLCILFASSLLGCSDSGQSSMSAAADRATLVDRSIGRIVAERACRQCHGLDGQGAVPAMPHIGGQTESYLLAALREYAHGERTHAPLMAIPQEFAEADLRNAVAYYASLPPPAGAASADIRPLSPYEQGRRRAEACASCHGKDGNSLIRGTPSLAGQQPHYLVAAIERQHPVSVEKGTQSIRGLRNRIEVENLALYFAAQTPVQRSIPEQNAAVTGKALAANCGGCHGSEGASNDASTPNLAGQDFDYLVKAIRRYRSARGTWGMHRYVLEMSDRDVEYIAAYYAAQRPRAAGPVPTSTEALAQKCNQCHGRDRDSVNAPRLAGQDKDYLIMALSAYRDGRRHSSTMHNLSFTYSNTVIESLAVWYASQPAD